MFVCNRPLKELVCHRPSPIANVQSRRPRVHDRHKGYGVSLRWFAKTVAARAGYLALLQEDAPLELSNLLSTKHRRQSARRLQFHSTPAPQYRRYTTRHRSLLDLVVPGRWVLPPTHETAVEDRRQCAPLAQSPNRARMDHVQEDTDHRRERDQQSALSP